MTYQKTLDYLFSQLPMYQRVGKAAYKADLNNTLKMMDILNHPEKKFKSVHVAGTNGKGSSSHMLASVLQESGYKVGLYTSPHLIDFRERIKINGKLIPKNYIVTFVEKYKNLFQEIRLSFFEWTVGLAFNYFKDEKVDIAVIEVGLGGRLDSTNVIHPEVSLITNIGFDHMQFLGDNLLSIAAEKAGIIKPETPVVISEHQKEIEAVFINKANASKSPIYFANQIKHLFETDLLGDYQQKNIKGVIKTIDLLIEKGWKITPLSIKKGLKNTVKNTGLLGRWQIISNAPMVICDTGHNKEGITIIVNQLKKQAFKNLHIVYGCVNDKDVSEILNILPKNAAYYFCKASIPRSLSETELQEKASKHGLKGEAFNNVASAYKAAKNNADKDDLIFIGGSTFVVADFLSDFF